METKKINLTIPYDEKKTFEKIIKRASKNIDGLTYTIGQAYKKTYRHLVVGEGQVKRTHTVVDVEFEIPIVNDWLLLATVKEGALFFTNPREKVEFKNGHGRDYEICDVCKHKQWRKSFIIRNVKTNEELQVGSECAKKFGIGMVDAIYKLMNSLFEVFDFGAGDDMGDDEPIWGHAYVDPHAVESVEASRIILAAKAYYDKKNGAWQKGYYVGRTYYPSQSVTDLMNMIGDFRADDEDEYYKSLVTYLNETFQADSSEFSQAIKDLGRNYYATMKDLAVAFFAIKNFEAYKREQEAKANGLYIPKVNDYVHIKGNVVSKETKQGYYGEYVVYKIKNELDGLEYTRQGVVKANEAGEVDQYAYIKSIWKNIIQLDRLTANPKKGVEIVNE